MTASSGIAPEPQARGRAGRESGTIGAAIDAAASRLADAGSASPRLDAELLLADLLGVGRSSLVARRPEPLPEPAVAPFEARIARRAGHEPVAYILGRQEFYGLELEVTPAVLIPRPETELVVDEVLQFLREGAAGRVCEAGRGGAPAEAEPPWGATGSHPRAGGDARRAVEGALSVVDVGTGSGCIAVAVAVHAPSARVIALDRSGAALDVARRNARRHAVAGEIAFVQGDLLSALAGPLDVVAGNLPYVSTAEVEGLMPDVRLYEPRAALDGGADGLALLRPLVAQAAGRLVPGGLLVLEVALGRAGAVADLLRSTGAFCDVSTRRDLAGIERVVRGRTWTGS